MIKFQVLKVLNLNLQYLHYFMELVLEVLFSEYKQLSNFCICLCIRKSAFTFTKLKTHLILLLKGGYYVVNKTESKLPFHLIGLNTNIYYKSNNLVKPDEYDPLGQFKWLKDVLTDIQIKGEKAFIFAHISPGKFERYYEQPEEEYSGFHWFRPDFNTKFIDEIILPFSKTIIAQVR